MQGHSQQPSLFFPQDVFYLLIANKPYYGRILNARNDGPAQYLFFLFSDSCRKQYKHYQQEAAALPNVIFGGRLGTYRYLNMDDTIAQALACFEQKIKPCLQGGM